MVAPWQTKKNLIRKKQADAIEDLSCGETVGEMVCCAKEDKT